MANRKLCIDEALRVRVELAKDDSILPIFEWLVRRVMTLDRPSTADWFVGVEGLRIEFIERDRGWKRGRVLAARKDHVELELERNMNEGGGVMCISYDRISRWRQFGKSPIDAGDSRDVLVSALDIVEEMRCKLDSATAQLGLLKIEKRLRFVLTGSETS